jgi:hypothetical protein
MNMVSTTLYLVCEHADTHAAVTSRCPEYIIVCSSLFRAHADLRDVLNLAGVCAPED